MLHGWASMKHRDSHSASTKNRGLARLDKAKRIAGVSLCASLLVVALFTGCRTAGKVVAGGAMTAIMLSGQAVAGAILLPVGATWAVSRAFPDKDGVVDAVYAPDGGRILCAVRTEGRQQLFEFDCLSETWTQLAEGYVDASFPAYSPDGRRIVFCAREEGSKRLGLFSLEGGGAPESLLTASPELTALSPCISPDGDAIAFVGITEHAPAQVYVVSLQQGAPKQLTDGPCDALYPQYLPNSREIVYLEASSINTGTGKPDGKFCVVSVDSGEVRYLGDHEFEGVSSVEMAWNGNELFIDHGYGWPIEYIHRLPVSPPNALAPLSPQGEGYSVPRYGTEEHGVERHWPAASPDGRWLAFAMVTKPFKDTIFGTEGPYSVHLMDLDSGRAHRVSDQSWPAISKLSFSPDGTTILLVTDTRPASPSRGRRELWTMACDGSRITRHDAPDSPTRR